MKISSPNFVVYCSLLITNYRYLTTTGHVQITQNAEMSWKLIHVIIMGNDYHRVEYKTLRMLHCDVSLQ